MEGRHVVVAVFTKHRRTGVDFKVFLVVLEFVNVVRVLLVGRVGLEGRGGSPSLLPRPGGDGELWVIFHSDQNRVTAGDTEETRDKVK